MKRKYMITVCVVLAVLLTGCGSRKDRLSDEYQQMWGMSKEEADEMAEMMDEALAEEEEMAKSQAEEQKKKEASLDAITLVGASKEIKSSKLGDDLIQIGDVVVKTDGSLTVGELNKELQACFNSKLVSGNEEVTDVSLENATSFGTPFVSILSVKDEAENPICSIKYINPTDSTINIFDCVVVGMEPNDYSLYSLNFFYPGNICAGTYSSQKNVLDSDLYQERISSYPAFTFQNAESEFTKAGAENINGTGSFWNFATISKAPIFTFAGKEYYKKTTYSYQIDTNSALVNKFQVKEDYYDGDAVVGNLSDFSTITDEQRHELEGYCSAFLSDWFMDRTNSSVEIIGYFLDEHSDCIAICKTDRDTFEPVKFVYEQHFDGSTIIEERVSDCYNDPYKTLEDLLNTEEMQENSYFAID